MERGAKDVGGLQRDRKRICFLRLMKKNRDSDNHCSPIQRSTQGVWNISHDRVRLHPMQYFKYTTSTAHACIYIYLATRRVQHSSGVYSVESRYLAEGTEIARPRRRFSVALQKVLSLRMQHHLCRQGRTLARSQ